MSLKDLFIIIEAYLRSFFSFRLFKIRDHLYQSGHLDHADLDDLKSNKIHMVIDLEGGEDIIKGNIYLKDVVPVYIYHPIWDADINSQKEKIDEMYKIADMAMDCIKKELNVLSHCQGGVNRASLMNGIILYKMGYRGRAIVKKIRAGRPGALTNDVFQAYLESLR